MASLVEGGWWTPARLQAVGLRASAICKACGEKVGTLYHRLGDSAATREEREGDRGCPRWLLRRAKAHVWDPLFARGIPALPKVPPPPPAMTVYKRTPAQAAEGVTVSGDVYTDGALRGRWRQVMRGGWGVVVLAPDRDTVEWSMHGSCPDVYPTVLRAELMAVLEALRHAVPPLCLHIDNAEVVAGLGRGREWCTQPCRDGADLWRQVWHYLDELGPGVTHDKVKAHTEVGDVALGIIPEETG